jgi:hypothetical protein
MLIVVKVKITQFYWYVRVNTYISDPKSNLFGKHFFFEQWVLLK